MGLLPYMYMCTICPTVTAYDSETFTAQLGLVNSFAKRIHIDLMDGVFTPTKSPYLSEITISSPAVVDIHVMYKNPDSILPQLIAIKPHLVIIHAESDADVPLFASRLREQGIQAGVALLPETPVAFIKSWLPHLQHVLIFGGHLGYHGGQADLAQAHKASELKTLHKYIECSWDGGANRDNALQLKNSGIDVINVGSGIHKAPDPAAEYSHLTRLVQ